MLISSSQTYAKALNGLLDAFPPKKANVLITGASGLIGSCIVDALYSAGYNVYALDLKRERLEERFGLERDGLHFISQDICDALPNSYEFEYIVHAASFADPKSYGIHPAETILINVIGTKNVLDYAKTHKNCRVLLTSTFEVYGKLDSEVCKESDAGVVDFNIERSCYPESKRTAEVLLRSYVDEYGVDAVIVRFSSIYGPMMQKTDSKAHAQFLFSAFNGKDIVLKSEGKQRRTYTYVIDAVSALFYVLFKGRSGEAYNVANGSSIISIAELASLIASLGHREVVHESPEKLEEKNYLKPQDCILDTTKLAGLGYTARYGIKEGLAETLQIMKEYL